MMKKPDFYEAFDRLIRMEGYDVNHKQDPGGHTIFGITSRWFPKTFEKLAQASTVEEQLDIAESFYKTEFWIAMGLDGFNSHYVACWFLDFSVNTGPNECTSYAQKTVNLFNEIQGREQIAVDGALGPITQSHLNRIARRYEPQLIAWLNWYQGTRYMELYSNNKGRWKHFLIGMGRRMLPPAKLLEENGLQ